jgi:ketosteroid isomerase-like protein
LELSEYFAKMLELFPETAFTVSTVLTEGDQSLVRWHLTARFHQTMGGYGKVSTAVATEGVSVVRVEHGLITEWSDYYDPFSSCRTSLGHLFSTVQY